MPATEASPGPATLEPAKEPANAVHSGAQVRPGETVHEPAVQGTLVPWPIRVSIAGTQELEVTGLIKSITARGLDVITPARVRVQRGVLITIAGCQTIPADLVYCVQKSPAFHAGIVFSRNHKPGIAVGNFAVVRELEASLSITRGHVMDIENRSLSILCKTTLKPNTWVRVESNGSIVFGKVKTVVATSMVASLLEISFHAAFPSLFAETVSAQHVQSEPAGRQM